MSKPKTKTDVTVETTETSEAPETAVAPATNPVAAELAKYGASEETVAKVINELGAETLEDLAVLSETDLQSAGMKLAKARKLVTDLRSAAHKVEAAEASTALQAQYEVLLPSVPTDDSWLSALKTGGVLKIDDSSYIAAIRAALAQRVGLFDIPARLSAEMERYADETDEVVDPLYFKLRQELTRHNYGEIFAAISGLDGSFISDKRRREFLARVDDNLWPAIASSFNTLDACYKNYCTAYTNPTMMFAALSGGLNTGAGVGLIPQFDAAPLHDAGDELIDVINHVFRGVGVQVAAALAYDAKKISDILAQPQLPVMIGAKNREQMLKKIGANVSSNYVRQENNLVRYVLGFVKHDSVTSDAEAEYFVALWQLGNQLNLEELMPGFRSRHAVSLTGRDVL